MSEKTVETKVETAVVQPEAKTVNEAEVEETELEKTRAELAKVKTDRDNYRKGLLKAKGKLPEEEEADDTPPENWREEARKIAREEYLSTQEAQLQAKEEAQVKAILKRNKELTIALKNRGQITSNTASGSNEEKPEVKVDSYFSPEQIASLKAKGWSDAKIEAAKKNMKSPQSVQP